MALRECREIYRNAMIDCSDMTLTEYTANGTRTYSIEEILKRWANIPDIEIEIRQKTGLPEDKG